MFHLTVLVPIEVPEDMPYRHHHTSWEDDSPSSELMSRVLIKLWTEGERNFIGGSTYKVEISNLTTMTRCMSPTVTNIWILKRNWYESPQDQIRSSRSRNFCGCYEPLPELRVLDIATSGINPV